MAVTSSLPFAADIYASQYSPLYQQRSYLLAALATEQIRSQRLYRAYENAKVNLSLLTAPQALPLTEESLKALKKKISILRFQVTKSQQVESSLTSDLVQVAAQIDDFEAHNRRSVQQDSIQHAQVGSFGSSLSSSSSNDGWSTPTYHQATVLNLGLVSKMEDFSIWSPRASTYSESSDRCNQHMFSSPQPLQTMPLSYPQPSNLQEYQKFWEQQATINWKAINWTGGRVADSGQISPIAAVSPGHKNSMSFPQRSSRRLYSSGDSGNLSRGHGTMSVSTMGALPTMQEELSTVEREYQEVRQTQDLNRRLGDIASVTMRLQREAKRVGNGGHRRDTQEW